MNSTMKQYTDLGIVHVFTGILSFWYLRFRLTPYRCVFSLFVHIHVAVVMNINEGCYKLIFVFSTVMSLKCKVCTSAKSWDDCEDKDVTCPSGIADRCIKLYLKYGNTTQYAKSCGTKDYCDKDKNPTCKAVKAAGVECTIDCCEGDLCNAGSAARISGILLAACTMALLVFQNA